MHLPVGYRILAAGRTQPEDFETVSATWHARATTPETDLARENGGNRWYVACSIGIAPTPDSIVRLLTP